MSRMLSLAYQASRTSPHSTDSQLPAHFRRSALPCWLLPQHTTLLSGRRPQEKNPPASTGQHIRHRLNRRGDRQLNQEIHTIAISRSRYCPKTRSYIAKRTHEGKTTRETRRCLKRYIARQLYRLLENPPPTPNSDLEIIGAQCRS